MKAETLRKSILQWAVEGKLVPQLDCELAVEQIGEAPEDVPLEPLHGRGSTTNLIRSPNPNNP